MPRRLERGYPYAWLGILADVAPSTDDLIYALHPDGFAMHSMRSLEVSRLYLQVDPAENIDDWSDARIWEALQTRLGVAGWTLHEGTITEKSITPMRSFVASTLELRPAVPGRRRRPHRAADGRKRTQLGDLRRHAAGAALVAHLDGDDGRLRATATWRSLGSGRCSSSRSG